GEMQSIPDASRPLRVVHRFQAGHLSTTDVALRSEGRDLYIRFGSQPRTLLIYLRYVWMAGMFLALFFPLLYLYLIVTGARTSWAKDYADNYAPKRYVDQEMHDQEKHDKRLFLMRAILEGSHTTNWRQVRERLRGRPETLAAMPAYLRKFLQAQA